MKTMLWVMLFLCTSVLFAEVLFYDNFNRADGAVGNSWTNIGSATTAIENNALKITSPNGSGIKRDFTAITSGILYLQFDWKVNSTGWYADAFPTGLMTHLTWDVDGNLCYDLDGTMISPVLLQNVSMGNYVNLRLKIDLDTDTFSIWVNDILAAENIAGNVVSSFSSFTFRGLGAITVQYVDNFILMNTSRPTGFTASGHLNDIDLNWDLSTYPEIVTYLVMRDTTSPAGTLLTELPGTQSTFTDVTAEPNTDYFYRIIEVITGSTESEYSTEVSAHLQPQIRVSPQNITFDVGYGYSDSTYVTISNTGNYPLEWYLSDNVTGGIPVDGLVSYYPFDGNCTDVNNTNTGVVYGAELTADRFNEENSAYHFDYDDYIRGTTNGFPTGTNDRTMMGWFKVDNFGDGELVFWCYGVFDQQHIIGMRTVTWWAGTRPGVATVVSVVDAQTSLATGTWYFLGFKNEGTNISIYINGVLDNTGVLPLDTITDGNDFYIGSTNYGYIRPFWGTADDFFMYDRALSDAEILELYQTTSHKHMYTGLQFGTIETGLSDEIKIKIDAANMNCGTHVDTLYVRSNDQNNSLLPIVITTNVLPPVPIITPDPLIVNLNVENPIREIMIQLHNQGEGKLIYTLAGTDEYGNPNQLPDTDGFTALGVYGAHRYYESTGNMTWSEAKILCEQKGGHLATISSDAENAFIYQTMSYDGWIGLTDEANEGTWVWVNDEPVSYVRWGNDEPNNSGGNEDWVCLWKNGGDRDSYWNDWGTGIYLQALLEYDTLISQSILSFSPSQGLLARQSSSPISLAITGINLLDGIYYSSIQVAAEGGVGPWYFPVTVNVDYTPPFSVSGLAIDAAATNDDQIGITWWSNAVADSVVAYKIYRRGADETEWQLKATVPWTQLSYIDSDFGDFVDTYQYYRVRAVDWVGNVGAVGDSVMGALNRFLNPENIVIQNVNNRDIHLSWDPVTETISGTPGTPSCYVIYKSQYPSPITDFDFLAISFTNEFTHQWALHFQPLNRLFYIVTAYGGDMGRMQSLVAQKKVWKYGKLEQVLKESGFRHLGMDK